MRTLSLSCAWLFVCLGSSGTFLVRALLSTDRNGDCLSWQLQGGAQDLTALCQSRDWMKAEPAIRRLAWLSEHTQPSATGTLTPSSLLPLFFADLPALAL